MSARLRTTPLLAMLILLTSFGAGHSATKEEDFWTWFQANEYRLHDFSGDRSLLMQELNLELAKVNESLTFHMGPIDIDNQRTFTISAAGVFAGFPAVEALHAAAPELPRWTVTKFLQRKRLDRPTIMGPADPAEIYREVRYVMASNGDAASITLFLPAPDNLPAHPAGEIAVSLLLDVLGEEDYGRHVEHLSLSKPSDPRYNMSSPLVELPAEFDATFKN